MNPNISFSVRFLLCNNQPGAMTRIVADVASTLVRWGIPVTVLFPAVDWWDFRLFSIRRMRPSQRWKSRLKLTAEFLWRIPFKRRWCGFKYHAVDPRVQAIRHWISPTNLAWNTGEVTVVHPPYLIPHLLRTLPDPKIKIVSALHMNLEKAMESSHPETAAWFRHWVARERLVSVPRYTTSQAARQAAERLGISVQKVIYDGSVDLALFRPSPSGTRSGQLVISLYCDRNAQKGQREGVRAFRKLKAALPNVRLCSIGHVLPENVATFDRNYGFLHREALVDALQGSDIFVYPSLFDGFPAPPLQAMACATALVTTAVEGVEEYALHEQNAMVCAPGDVDQMFEQILRLAKDPQLRERLQANGPKTAEAFSLERGCQQLLDFLCEVHEEQPVASMEEALA